MALTSMLSSRLVPWMSSSMLPNNLWERGEGGGGGGGRGRGRGGAPAANQSQRVKWGGMRNAQDLWCWGGEMHFGLWAKLQQDGDDPPGRFPVEISDDLLLLSQVIFAHFIPGVGT